MPHSNVDAAKKGGAFQTTLLTAVDAVEPPDNDAAAIRTDVVAEICVTRVVDRVLIPAA